MRMKASEVGGWLRQIAGKRDHRKAMPDDDYLVLRPGPDFDLLNPVATQLPALAPEEGPADDDREAGADDDKPSGATQS